MKRYFALGVITTLAALALLAIAFIEMGWIPVNADTPPPALEQWLAQRALSASVRRLAPRGPNPQPLTPENLAAGMQLFGDNCYGCHRSGDTSYYPPIPKFEHSFGEPDGELFYMIKHGIRLSAMPSSSLKDEDIWKIVLFLKNLDKLPPNLQEEWGKG